MKFLDEKIRRCVGCGRFLKWQEHQKYTAKAKCQKCNTTYYQH